MTTEIAGTFPLRPFTVLVAPQCAQERPPRFDRPGRRSPQVDGMLARDADVSFVHRPPCPRAELRIPRRLGLGNELPPRRGFFSAAAIGVAHAIVCQLRLLRRPRA